MTDRLAVFQKKLAEHGVGCAVIGPTASMHYLLGGTPLADERLCLLLVTKNEVQMVAPRLNEEQIAGFTDVELLTWDDAGGYETALSKSIIVKNRPGTVGIDGSMRADFLLAVLEQVRPKRTLAVDPIIAKQRIRKSPEEIDALARSLALADRAVAAAAVACRPGVTEAEVAWAAEKSFREDGAQRVEFTQVAAGLNAALPHYFSADKKLEEGEGIIIDIGASLGGYKSDITRMVFLGEPGREFLEAFELVLAANAAGREAVRPGMTAEELDRTVRSVIERGGKGEYFIHRTGHGIGLDVHEEPWIQAGGTTPLEEGMVFSIEPGVYIPGKFGIRVEDIVAVTAQGGRTLTGADRGLKIK